MSLKELLAVDCGGRNPLLDAASHLTRDQGLRQDNLRIERGISYGPEEFMVREFLEETKADQETIIRRAPQSFQMNRLLEDLREIESTRQISVRPGPSVSAIARVEPGALWASEFLETVKDVPHTWVDEFQTTTLPMAPPLEDVWQSVSHPVPLASDLLQQSEVWTNEFATTSSQPVEQKADEWVAEFTEEKKEDFWEKLEADWQRAALDSPMDLPWLEASAFQQNNDYKFADDNPLMDLPDSLQQGKQRRAAGDLPSAVLFFEAAVQKDPTLVEGWLLLGLTLAENEQDPAAVRALNKCLSLDPSVLDARMALAISYTNEGLQMQACKELEDWLAANPKYSHLVPLEGRLVDQRSTVSSLVSGSLYMRLQNMYTEAARLMVDGSIDADVQTGLGVLLNLAGEYTKAGDCFRAALTVRPNDALLWNRLGATLANGGNSEEAVEAYSTALNLSPGFIRSRYNLAVACVNLRAYREAAEHLVSALNMQASAKAPGRAPNTSDNIWSTLRTVLSMLGRRDLIPDVDKRERLSFISEVLKEDQFRESKSAGNGTKKKVAKEKATEAANDKTSTAKTSAATKRKRKHSEEAQEIEEKTEHEVAKKKARKDGAKKTEKVKEKKTEVKNKSATDFASLNFACEQKTTDGHDWNFKIACWNISGVRAWQKTNEQHAERSAFASHRLRVSVGYILVHFQKDGMKYFDHEKPDIMCVQEIKISEDKLDPSIRNVPGYTSYWCLGSTDGYAGVGIYTKVKPISVTKGIGDEAHDKEGRVITAEYEKFYLVNAYVPNAGRGLVRLEERMKWDPLFRNYLKKLDEKKPVIICGDMNVSHLEIDLANPKSNKRNAGFTQEERDGFTALLAEGFVDTYRHLYPDKTGVYTFWTYMANARSRNIGWRLDYFLLSKRLSTSFCDHVVRSDVFGSDHCPIVLLLHV